MAAELRSSYIIFLRHTQPRAAYWVCFLKSVHRMPQEHQKHCADICEASSASAARSEGGKKKKSGQVFDFS